LINIRQDLVLSKGNSEASPGFLLDFVIIFLIAYMIASISTEVNSKGVINSGPSHFQTIAQFLMFQEWK